MSPPLAGKVFISHWGQKNAAELVARFQITVSDPFFRFEDINDYKRHGIIAGGQKFAATRVGLKLLVKSGDGNHPGAIDVHICSVPSSAGPLLLQRPPAFSPF